MCCIVNTIINQQLVVVRYVAVLRHQQDASGHPDSATGLAWRLWGKPLSSSGIFSLLMRDVRIAMTALCGRRRHFIRGGGVGSCINGLWVHDFVVFFL
jgi:hypothetical protein